MIKENDIWTIKYCKEVIRERKKNMEEEENIQAKEIWRESLEFWTEQLKKIENIAKEGGC